MAKDISPPPVTKAEVVAWIAAWFKTENIKPEDQNDPAYGKAYAALTKYKAAYEAQKTEAAAKRPVDSSVAAGKAQEYMDALSGLVPGTVTETFPLRNVRGSKENMAAGAVATGIWRYGGGAATYSLNKLVDENQNVTSQDKHQPNDLGSVMSFLSSITDTTTRAVFLRGLQEYSFYSGKGKPSALALSGNGFQDADYAAVDTFLVEASRRGLTGLAFFPVMTQGMKTYSGSGDGSPAAFTSREDSAFALRSAAFKYLGRPLTDAEMQAAVQTIAKNERARTGSPGGEQPAQISTAAEIQVKKAAPQDAAEYGLNAAMQRLFATLGG